MDVGDWIAVAGTLFGGLAAYFAWQTYRRKPKLRITLLPESLKRLRTYRGDGGYLGGQIMIHIENPGKIAAKNVVGWLHFDHEYLVPHRHDEEYSLGQNETVTVQTPILSPNPTVEDDSSPFQIGKEFKIRVETKQSGKTKLRYSFVCDEGVHIENVLSITVPPIGSYSEKQLAAFLKAIRDNPRKWTKSQDLAVYLRSVGQDIGLSDLDLRLIFRDALNDGYIATALTESSDHFLAVTFKGERMHVPQYLELSIKGEWFLNDRIES